MFRPKIHVEEKYERDEPAPPRTYKRSQTPMSSTSVGTDDPDVPAVGPVAIASVDTNKQTAVLVKDTKTEDEKPFDPFENDPDARAMVARDPKAVATGSGVEKAVGKMKSKADAALKSGEYMKAFKLYEHAHKILAIAIRNERDEKRLDHFDDLDSAIRKGMLEADRMIKQFGNVKPKPVEQEEQIVAHVDREESDNRDAEDTHTQQQTQAYTEQTVACFKCGRMVHPIPSHSFPSWLACCCPAYQKCPECGENVEGDLELEEDASEAGDAEDDDNVTVDGTINQDDNQTVMTRTTKQTQQTHTTRQTQQTRQTQLTGTSNESVELMFCHDCGKQVEPVRKESMGCMAGMCFCCNVTTYYCPECDEILDQDQEEGEEDGDDDASHDQTEHSESNV